jgi:hypothetical protein
MRVSGVDAFEAGASKRVRSAKRDHSSATASTWMRRVTAMSKPQSLPALMP